MKKGRILLIDGDDLFRLWLRHMLEQEEDIEVVGDCTSAEEALSRVETLSPNIVLMDIWLPGMNGIEACCELTKNTCDVIMLTKDQELIHYALKAGASGYYPKEIKYDELIMAIKLACKWQSLKAECAAYSARQMEATLTVSTVERSRIGAASGTKERRQSQRSYGLN